MPSITTPTTVINQDYDTSGNGGRKLVRLSNGWLVAVAKTTNWFYFYVSKDNGRLWSELCKANYNIDQSVSIVSNGTTVYCLISFTSQPSPYYFKFDATTITGIIVAQSNSPDSNQTSIGNCSLAISPDGNSLWAAWSSKNSTYPNSSNIRTAKGTINGDGSVVWGVVTQVTTFNSLSTDQTNPCVIVKANGQPTIIAQYIYPSNNNIVAHNFNGTSWSSAVIYAGSTYAQQFPCAVEDNNDVIHVVWHGADSANSSVYNIKYSKSVDGGQTWETITKLTTGNTYHRSLPVITVDKNNKLYVLFQGVFSSVSASITNILQTIFNGSSWSAVTNVTANSTNNADFASILYDKTMDFSEPLIIYSDHQAANIKFRGTWTTTSITMSNLSFPDLQWTINPNGDTVVDCKLKINNVLKQTFATNSTSPLSYTLTESDLLDGNNSIALETTDSNGGTYTKTLNANKVGTPIIPYQIDPTKFDIDGALSIHNNNENETYQSMDKTTMGISNGLAETQLIGHIATAKSKGTVRLTMTRTDLNDNKTIKSILGAVN